MDGFVVLFKLLIINKNNSIAGQRSPWVANDGDIMRMKNVSSGSFLVMCTSPRAWPGARWWRSVSKWNPSMQSRDTVDGRWMRLLCAVLEWICITEKEYAPKQWLKIEDNKYLNQQCSHHPVSCLIACATLSRVAAHGVCLCSILQMCCIGTVGEAWCLKVRGTFSFITSFGTTTGYVVSCNLTQHMANPFSDICALTLTFND